MDMPFDRYLQHQPQSTDPTSHYGAHDVDDRPNDAGLRFQLPTFVFGAQPTVAQGGGAEVLPPGMFGASSSWMTQDDGEKYIDTSSYTPLSLTPPAPALPVDAAALYPYPPAGYPPQTHPHPLAALSVPSSLGLPVYSASGFDLLSVLARVATRPAPKVVLGPVDLTCSFVVVDVRRFDAPIVYASPSFCQLTGYSEQEVLGRNCRFLQAPGARVSRGEDRKFTSPEAVTTLRKALVAHKEIQTSLINYKKSGQAFINLVSVIPIGGGVSGRPEERDEVVYHVGFQVDLTQQPNAILQRLKDGSYIVNYSAGNLQPLGKNKRQPLVASVSEDLRLALARPDFARSLQSLPSVQGEVKPGTEDHPDADALLHALLLESSPDFVHVLSLKGSFLYVAPSVKRVLGYDAEELAGKSITDYCHPADVVPLMRELKESSAPTIPVAPAVPSSDGSTVPLSTPSTGQPKTVDLLFRAQEKDGGYVWIECRGRLHVEPGKGRKAIVMSGRRRAMPCLRWANIAKAPVTKPQASDAQSDTADGSKPAEIEFWGMAAQSGTLLVVGAGVRDVLGWGVGEAIGRALHGFLDPNDREGLAQLLQALRPPPDAASPSEAKTVRCSMLRKDGANIAVEAVLWHSTDWDSSFATRSPSSPSGHRPPPPVVLQIRIAGSHLTASSDRPSPTNAVHPPTSNVFEELDTARGTSWQYELQQLKFANQRLAEEVASLQTTLDAIEGSRAGAASGTFDTSAKSTDWADSSVYGAGRKRAWEADGADGGGG